MRRGQSFLVAKITWGNRLLQGAVDSWRKWWLVVGGPLDWLYVKVLALAV